MIRRAPRLIDELIDMRPDLRESLEKAASEFYAARQDQLGKQLVSQRLITQDLLEIALARQRAHSGKATRKDIEILHQINAKQNERLSSRVDSIGLMCARLATAKAGK